MPNEHTLRGNHPVWDGLSWQSCAYAMFLDRSGRPAGLMAYINRAALVVSLIGSHEPTTQKSLASYSRKLSFSVEQQAAEERR
jgi:hypothetical protein